MSSTYKTPKSMKKALKKVTKKSKKEKVKYSEFNGTPSAGSVTGKSGKKVMVPPPHGDTGALHSKDRKAIDKISSPKAIAKKVLAMRKKRKEKGKKK